MRAGQDRKPDHMDAFSAAAATIASGGEADAVINDVHAGIAGAHGDLLGAVGMAVEARLADQEFEPAAELLRYPSTSARRSSRPSASLRMAVPTPVGARYSPKAPRSAKPHSPVVTPALAHAIEAGMMLAPSARGALERGERRRDGVVVARRAPGIEPLDLLGLGFRRHRDHCLVAGGQRRRLGLDDSG